MHKDCKADNMTARYDAPIARRNLDEVAAIRAALVAGERSGTPERVDFSAFKQRKFHQLSLGSEPQQPV